MGTPLRTSKWRCILARSVLVVHPQGPNHFWQGIENGAIDGTEIFEGLGLTTVIQRQSPTSDFLKDGPQVLGGKDFR